jgi:hypothetical protein
LERRTGKGRERWRPLAAQKDPTDDPINTSTYRLLPLPGLPVPGFWVDPPAPLPDCGFLPCELPPELEPPIPPPLLDEPPMPPLPPPCDDPPLPPDEPPDVPLIPPDLEPPEGFEALEPLELPELPGLPDFLGLFGSLMLLRSFSRSAMVLPPIVKSMPGTDAPGECDLGLAASVPHTTKDIE